MLLGLPLPDARLQDLVLARRLVDHVTHPRMPTGLDVAGVEFLVFVVDPAGAQGELFLHVLEESVSVAVGTD